MRSFVRHLRRVGPVVAGVAALAAGPLRAQAPGLPIINAGVARGVTLGAQLGFPNGAAGDGTAFGVVGSLGFRRLAVGAVVAGVSGADWSNGTVRSVGGNLTVKLAGGPLVPIAVNLQAGAAYVAPDNGYDGARAWRMPVGIGISWTIPQPVVAVKPWIAPRIDHTRTRGPDPALDPLPGGPVPMVNTTETDLGVSAGVSFGFLNGLGLEVAIDRVFGEGPGSKPTTFGVGISWSLK
ncbi:MAG: hypothetical protein IT352_03820 [Gemmatimonadales bacterium]|nr:hypothetical protein [Gemmatimonadales bacterium]